MSAFTEIKKATPHGMDCLSVKTPSGLKETRTSHPTRPWRLPWHKWIGRGIYLDVKRRIRYFASDWKDVWNYRVVPATFGSRRFVARSRTIICSPHSSLVHPDRLDLEVVPPDGRVDRHLFPDAPLSGRRNKMLAGLQHPNADRTISRI
jgi:hypothetical protein